LRAPTLALVLVAAALGSFGIAADAAPCPGFTLVPYQGPSCPVEGGWLVALADGTSVLTHGPDPAEPASVGVSIPPNPDPLPVSCAPAGTPRAQLMYAYPADGVDRSATRVETAKTYAEQANAHVRAEAAALGVSLRLSYACGADGRPSVPIEHLGATAAATSYSSIVNDLHARGYSDANTKYVVWYDGSVGGYCGQGAIFADSRPGAANLNNRGDMFAIVYGCGWNVLLHESGHTMGAVQLDAQHTSGAFHCNDGNDIMCYADGGSRSDYSGTACAVGAPFDCGHDDYFDPAPAPGSYLATHWDVGAPANRFLAFTPGCSAALHGTAADAALATPVAVPPGCQGKFFSLTPGPDSALLVYANAPASDYSVCWSAGAVTLRCDHMGATTYGAVPAAATSATVSWTGGVPGDFLLAMG